MAVVDDIVSSWERKRRALMGMIQKGSYLLVTNDHGGWRFFVARAPLVDRCNTVDVYSPWGDDDECPYDETLNSKTVHMDSPAEDHSHYSGGSDDWQLDNSYIDAVFNDRAEVDHAIEQLTDAERTIAAAVKPYEERFAVMVKLLSNVPE